MAGQRAAGFFEYENYYSKYESPAHATVQGPRPDLKGTMGKFSHAFACLDDALARATLKSRAATFLAFFAIAWWFLEYYKEF